MYKRQCVDSGLSAASTRLWLSIIWSKGRNVSTARLCLKRMHRARGAPLTKERAARQPFALRLLRSQRSCLPINTTCWSSLVRTPRERETCHGEYRIVDLLFCLRDRPATIRPSSGKCGGHAQWLHYPHLAACSDTASRPSPADRRLAHLPGGWPLDSLRSWPIPVCHSCQARTLVCVNYRRTHFIRITREYLFSRPSDDRDVLWRKLSRNRDPNRPAWHIYGALD